MQLYCLVAIAYLLIALAYAPSHGSQNRKVRCSIIVDLF